MNKTQSDFLATLFNPGESTCFSPDAYGINVDSFGALPTDIFFSINPLHSRRLDANVTAYRNILLEADKMPLEDQIAYVTSKIPVTSIVYSGGKSYHFIVSLDKECSTRGEYDLLVRRLHKLLPAVDPTTKNPSRFSRLPGVKRKDTNRMQTLEHLGSRISRATLEDLLPPIEAPKQHAVQPEGFFSTLVVDSMFAPDTVMAKIGIQSRNQFFFWLGKRLEEGNAGLEQKRVIVENTYAALKNVQGFSLTEAMQAARVN